MAGTAKFGAAGGGLLSARAPGAEQSHTKAGKAKGGWDEPVQRLALALVRAVSLDDVAAALVSYGTVAAGARWGHALLLDDVGGLGVSLMGGPAMPTRRLENLGLDAATPWNDAVRGGQSLVFPSPEALRQAYPALEPLVAGIADLGPVVTTPVTAVGEPRGAMTFGFDAPESDGGGAMVDAPLEAIAGLAGQAGARAAVYASEHQSAELLQRAYLPARLSTMAGLSFATRYLPAAQPVSVGGDWYDVVLLPGGEVGIIIGDVAGHGLQAAVVMSSLRGALRAFATVDACPAMILTRLNQFTCLFKPDAFATVFVGVFDAGRERLRYALAGHPPPVLLVGEQPPDVLDDALGPPLGFPGAAYGSGERPFPAGASLVAYTDGLIERRDQALDIRLQELVKAAEASAGDDPDALCDHVLFELLAGQELTDDAALLVVTRPGTRR